MRANEFITEASIFTKREKYGYGHKVKLNNKGQIIFDQLKTFFPDLQADEELTWIEQPEKLPKAIAYTSRKAARAHNARFFQRPNGKTFGIVGTDGVIQGMLNHAAGQKGSTAENKGDLSEPLLSAAVVAKLIKRGSDSIENVTEDDVKNVLTQALNNEKQTFSVNDRNSKIADNITFTIALRAPAIAYMKSSEFWESGAKGLIPSVVHYANSGQIDRYADYFFKNGKADTITIKSDGMSEQKSRKTDIEAYVKGEDGKTKLLRNLNISLKAGSPHIGQVGGGQIKNPTSKTGVVSNANRLFGGMGITIEAPAEITDKSQFWVEAYKQAVRQLKADLAGENAKTEAGVVAKIADFVTSQGTAGDPNVKLVSLGADGTSAVHSFKGLAQKLQQENINLDCSYREGVSRTGDPRPELRIFDRNNLKNILIIIRFSATQDGTKVWNTVEMHSLLKTLTTLRSERDHWTAKLQQPRSQDELDSIKKNAGIQSPVQNPQ